MNYLRIRKRKRELAEAIHRGRTLLVSGRDQETLEYLEVALQRFPDNPEIRLLYATILLAFRPEDVASEVARAVDCGSDDPVILVRAGGLMIGRGQLDAARSYLEDARKLAGPDFVLTSALLNHEGVLAFLDQDIELAEEKLSAAMEKDPASGPIAVDLARVLAARGRPADALEVIDRALPLAKQKDDLERMREKLVGGPTARGND